MMGCSVHPVDFDSISKAILSLSVEELERAVESIWRMRRAGRSRTLMMERFRGSSVPQGSIDIIMDIVKTRGRAGSKYSAGEELFFTSEGLRWATPEAAAAHCARRISGKMAVDVTCGQGGQILSLSRECDMVVGIELEPLNALISHMNVRAQGLGNVRILIGNCLDLEIISGLGSGYNVFCDPARPSGSKERTLDELSPDPREVMRAHSGYAEGFCFEVPPHLSLERVDFDCEAEFVSFEGRLNRLNLYTGPLKSSGRSCVVLPDGAEMSGPPSTDYRSLSGPEDLGGYLFEVDPAVVKAEMVPSIIPEDDPSAGVIVLDRRRVLLSVSWAVGSPFLVRGYHPISHCGDWRSLISRLRDMGAGSTTLRWEIPPEEYWGVRRSIEAELNGTKKVDIFMWNGYIIAERMTTANPGQANRRTRRTPAG